MRVRCVRRQSDVMCGSGAHASAADLLYGVCAASSANNNQGRRGVAGSHSTLVTSARGSVILCTLHAARCAPCAVRCASQVVVKLLELLLSNEASEGRFLGLCVLSDPEWSLVRGEDPERREAREPLGWWW